MTNKHEETQLIEATSKRYKGLQAIGVVMMCLGVATCAITAAGRGSGGTVAGMILSFGGLFLYLGARIAAWWQHG